MGHLRDGIEMSGYKPLKIAGQTSGLIQQREDFLLPDDAYPVLENAIVWRERIKRKQGTRLLGRLRRKIVGTATTTPASDTWDFNIFTVMGIAGEPNATIEIGSYTQGVDGGGPDEASFVDNGDGTLTGNTHGVSAGSTINYSTGDVHLVFDHVLALGTPSTFDVNYFPGLPVMGLRSRERPTVNVEQLVAFDTKYSYVYLGTGFQEFIPGTTWTGLDSDFFWSTNFWNIGINKELFWVTNFNTADPIRYTNGVTWTDFSPKINSAGDTLTQALIMLPFRSRMLALHTFEQEAAGNIEHFQRVRWCAIGNPIQDLTAVPPFEPWRDDVRGKGGFLDIPTSEQIVAAGFVRDNLVIYCEHSTWQLRYTGQSIAPFQIEKVNTELGAESTFSAVQFDTSLVGVGDKGIIECDSFKSERIDTKIIDLVFLFNNLNEGPKRVHGVRDFEQRLAYWTFPTSFKPQKYTRIFPNRRLVFNYENQSWAIHKDSFTCFGTYQKQTTRTWATTPYPWETQNYTWVDRPALFPDIVAGNQVGFVQYIDVQTTNDVSLIITAITSYTITSTILTIPNHNLDVGDIIKVSRIPTGSPFATSLNGGIFYVEPTDEDNVKLWVYNSTEKDFSLPQLDTETGYVGGGMISVRDNFRVLSKKFNSMDEGQKLQIGYIDILTNTSQKGAISLNVYNDYNESPTNSTADSFFNVTVPTTISALALQNTTKAWQRVYCPTRANTIQIEWTLSNAQMIGEEQESDVQIDAQILWARSAGRLTI